MFIRTQAHLGEISPRHVRNSWGSHLLLSTKVLHIHMITLYASTYTLPNPTYLPFILKLAQSPFTLVQFFPQMGLWALKWLSGLLKWSQGHLPHFKLFTFVLLAGSMVPWPQSKIPSLVSGWFRAQVQFRFLHSDNTPSSHPNTTKPNKLYIVLVLPAHPLIINCSTLLLF